MTSFYGWDIVRYYWYVWQNWFAGFSWQVRVAYSIVILCIFAMLVLGMVFFISVRKRRKKEKQQKKTEEKYFNTIKEILLADTLSGMEILSMLQAVDDEDQEDIKKQAEFFIPILVQIRTEVSDIPVFPNLQTLANITGVREYCENALLKNKNTFEVLQMIAMMQLVITEGRLANYVNSGDQNIRTMARLSYIICSSHDPYKYIIEELDNQPSMMKLMMMHYIFAWVRTQGKKLPNFIAMAENLKEDIASAFIINEIAYFGNEDDKAGISKFFMTEKPQTRKAAIENADLIPTKETCERLMNIYSSQPEGIKRTILDSVKKIDGKANLDFFERCYIDFVSKETKEKALICIHDIDKRHFNALKKKASDEDKLVMDKIDTLYKLKKKK